MEHKFNFHMIRDDAYRLVEFLHARRLAEYSIVTTSPELPAGWVHVSVMFHPDAKGPS